MAALLTRGFGRGPVWEAEQVAVFRELAKGYLPGETHDPKALAMFAPES